MLQFYSVLMQYLLCTTLYDSSTTPALLCTAKNYSVLFQYYSRTTKYYNIPLYYKVLLQCYSVLKSTTPELLCTKVALTIDPPHIWNIIYIARSNRCHPPASPNIAPATQNDSHHWSSHIWNVSFNARRSRHHPPTSPNTAPATQNCNPKSKRNLPKLVDDSSMIRVRLSMELQNWTRPLAEVTVPPIGNAFPIKKTCRAPAIYPNFTKYCACQKKWKCNITKCCPCHERWHCNITKCCACHEKWLSWLNLLTYETSFTLRSATGSTLHLTKYCACHAKLHSQI